MNDVIQVPFHGDVIEAVKDGDNVMVALRRPCESLGIDFSGQLQKLKRKKWATVEEISTVGIDGKTRQMTCLSLKSLPMWLATIDDRKVKPEVRDKLARYQEEAATVLADHFLSRHGPWMSRNSRRC